MPPRFNSATVATLIFLGLMVRAQPAGANPWVAARNGESVHLVAGASGQVGDTDSPTERLIDLALEDTLRLVGDDCRSEQQCVTEWDRVWQSRLNKRAAEMRVGYVPTGKDRKYVRGVFQAYYATINAEVQVQADESVARLLSAMGDVAEFSYIGGAVAVARGKVEFPECDGIGSCGAALAGVALGLHPITRKAESAVGERINRWTTPKQKKRRNKNCFVAGTWVQTPRGPRAIETLKAGDLVFARKDATGPTVARPIVQTFVNHNKETLDLQLRTASGTIERIRVTKDHPFYVHQHGWTHASALTPGATLVGLREPLTVHDSTATGQRETVYNFEVQGEDQGTLGHRADAYHNYFVGQAGVWVHNENDECETDVDPVQLLQRLNRRITDIGGEWAHIKRRISQAQQIRLARVRTRFIRTGADNRVGQARLDRINQTSKEFQEDINRKLRELERRRTQVDNASGDAAALKRLENELFQFVLETEQDFQARPRRHSLRKSIKLLPAFSPTMRRWMGDRDMLN